MDQRERGHPVDGGGAAQGRSNEEIAERLIVSVRTAESHVANIYGKIGVPGRTARATATAWAIGHRLT